jgi:hypothetical protein
MEGDNTRVGPLIELPILDISNPNDPAVGKAMLDAAATYGFLYVNSRGTDFTIGDVERAFGLVEPLNRMLCSPVGGPFTLYMFWD